MTMQMELPQRSAINSAVRHLVANYSPQGNRVGWLMMASILVEAWDLYSIAFVLIFIRDQYHPDPLLLGLAAAGTQGGAVIGALLGGWLSDKLGRRLMFLATMVLFIVLALAQAFVTSVAALAVIRLFLGVPLGSDIATGYTYIMEMLPKGQREVMGNRWQFMFAVGQVLTLAVIALFLIFDLNHEVDMARHARARRRAGAHHPDPSSRSAGDCGVAGSPGPFPRGEGGRDADVRRQARHAARSGRQGAQSPVRPRSSPISVRIRSAGAQRFTAGSPASPRAANSRPSPSIFPCCS